MTTQNEQHSLDSQVLTFWQPAATEAFTNLCQSEGLNPVRLRRLIDSYIGTNRKPSRQELIEALKHRPRIQERATILNSVTKKLNVFLETYS
jgi:hypothetical protein